MSQTKTATVRIGVAVILLAFVLGAAKVRARESSRQPPKTVKVAAVQVCGYDKTDVPREGYDPTDALVPYIDKAGKDGAQLVVFPEYVLGRIQVPGAEIIVWINGRGGTVEDFIVKSVTFQSHVAMICTNQAYGGGTMIVDWPTRIVARCQDRKEAYVTATVNLQQVRRARKLSRNFRQRRPDLYGELVNVRVALSGQDTPPTASQMKGATVNGRWMLVHSFRFGQR